MERIIKDLEKLVEYMWANELQHWEESFNPPDHIFHSINNVKNYLNKESYNGKNRKKRI